MHLYRSKCPAYRAAYVLSYGMRCPDFDLWFKELSEKKNRNVVNIFAGETVGRDSPVRQLVAVGHATRFVKFYTEIS